MSALLELSFPARPDQLRKTRDAVRACVEACGAGPECTGDIVMAVDEACQNIIRHAYGGPCDERIVLRVERDGDALIFWLRDFAPCIDPSQVRPRELDDVRPGGLGTHLIWQVMDEALFVDPPPDGGNLMRLMKRIG
jgi:sigma-B regulation protein RsbU (phosphoserine phosphatase)